MQDFATQSAGPRDGEGRTLSAAGPATGAGGRRISANSFRLLTERLRGKPVPPDVAAPVIDTAPESPEPHVSWTAPASDPVLVEELHESEIAPEPVLADEPEPEETPQPATFQPPIIETPFPQIVDSFALPSFVPLAPVGSLEPDRDLGPVVIYDELPAGPAPAAIGRPFWEREPTDSAVHETLPQPDVAVQVAEARSPAAMDLATEAPQSQDLESLFPVAAEEIDSAAKLAPAKPVLADKIADALLRTVTEAIYCLPTADERAAFLHDVAELVERDKSDASANPAIVEPDAIAGRVVAAPVPAAPESIEAPVVQPQPEPRELAAVLAGKLGPRAALLRKGADKSDPFAKSQPQRHAATVAGLSEADEDSGELALSLLDMMSASAGSAQPQERALAADTLLRLIPRVPPRQLLAVAERLAMMEAPPALLVARLIRDPRPELAAPLLERCMHISDQDLMTAASEADVPKQRMIARRRVISPNLSDQLIERDDASVLLTLVRNPGAGLTQAAFFRLVEHAMDHHAILAPMTTRADLPAPVAFELFWHVPQELRRFIFSRFLTDSETLNKILKITMATQGPVDGAAPAEAKFPASETIGQVVELCASGSIDQASQLLADISGVSPETALRILSDRDGEPIAVIMKAMGYTRALFGEALERLQKSDYQLLRADRKLAELQSIFDSLSFNKARILLTYWDWFIRKSGPYAPHH